MRQAFSIRGFGLGLALATLGASAPGLAQETVDVGGYIFPPYVEEGESGERQGLTLALIDALNAAQDTYRFAFFNTSPTWRYGDFQSGKYDVIFFENPSWGWDSRDIAYDATKVFLRDSEVYITRAKAGRSQAYFDTIADKRIGAVQGYHYAFADFRDDPAYLNANFKITLVDKPAKTIDLVLAGRTELSVVTRSYLNRYLANHPDQRDALLVSEKTDQIYRHRALVRPDAPLGAEDIESLLADLAATGTLTEIWSQVGLADRSAF